MNEIFRPINIETFACDMAVHVGCIDDAMEEFLRHALFCGCELAADGCEYCFEKTLKRL